MALRLLTVLIAAAVASTPAPSLVDELRTRLIERTHDLWNDVLDKRWVASATEEGGADLELLRAFQALGDTLEHRHQTPDVGSLWSWARAEAELRAVRGLYEAFRRFQQQQTRADVLPAPRRAWTDLAETILSDPAAAVSPTLDRLHELIIKGDGDGSNLFQQALKESGQNACEVRQSPQQVLYNLYVSVALTQLKGYAMMQFSWMLLRLYDKGNFTLEARLMRDQFEQRAVEQATAVRAAMRRASRELKRCDPQQHTEGATYERLTQLLQGHIQNEVDMNTETSCRENCAYYSYAKSHGCYDKPFCSKQPRCNGRLIDCRYMDSDMWVCPADSSGGRRYDWIEYENQRILGRKGTCSRPVTKVDSWWRWLFWHCSYCFCLCDEQGPRSDRYFNLREVKADVENNMVVTGLRFIKINRVVHLQIQEGVLVPQGGINTTTIRWRPADRYQISDMDVYNGVDYHTLSWEQRAIDLDDLKVKEGHILTGVRFRRLGTHLNLEIMMTPLNFSEGTLIQPKQKSEWHGNDNTDASLSNPRSRIAISNPDVPTQCSGTLPVASKPDQFLLFTHSSIDQDAAQTTVPYLDAQQVAPEPPTMLSGAGLYYKGRSGCGGFIAPKVFTYDYSQHISATVTRK